MPKAFFVTQALIDELRELIEQKQWTQARVAAHFGLYKSTIEKACRRFALRTQRTGPRTGALHTGWKGGRRLLGRYWYVYCPQHPLATKQHLVAEHRLVMEAILQRYLLREEVVHHRDGDPGNNTPENLAVFRTNGEHLRHELQGKIPQWSPEGLDKIRRGMLRAAAIHRKIKSDEDRRILAIDHPQT